MSTSTAHIFPQAETAPWRVLLIDSNKGNRHLLAAQLSAGLGLDVTLASALSDTRKILEQGADAFFVAVVNVKLKDSVEGEAVDLLNTHSIPIIAFSLQDDRALRDKVVSKFVLDYVLIKSRQHFEHIEKLVERIRRSYQTTILVVDRSLAFRFYICDLLTKHCYTVVEADTITTAMAKLRENPEIKLVVTDSSSEGINGIELVEAIRAQYKPQVLGVVAMSSSDNPEINVELLKAGASDFIRKPFAMEEFFCRVNQNVEILEYIEEIQSSMIRDYLTGAFNRRYLYEAGEQFYQNARRGNINIAVAMIDADKFKYVNDTYGHDVGDNALVCVAAVLKKTLRASDIVARFGGEEFVCIANCVGSGNVAQLFERVRESVSELEIQTPQGVLKITVSIGVTQTLGSSLDDMINRADQAMYAAKNSGRNCVVVR